MISKNDNYIFTNKRVRWGIILPFNEFVVYKTELSSFSCKTDRLTVGYRIFTKYRGDFVTMRLAEVATPCTYILEVSGLSLGRQVEY
jgi:hypothetical protein